MSSPKTSAKTSEAGERFEDLVAVLEAGLREHVPGFEALDRDLELAPAPGLGLASFERAVTTSGEPDDAVDAADAADADRPVRRADVAGVDRHGRLVLVLLVDGTSDESALSAFDALAFARNSIDALGQHFGARRMSSALEPLVVLVAESFSPRVLDALALVAGTSLRLFEMRAVRSASAGTAYLVPRTLGASVVRRSVHEFSAALPAAQRALVDEVLRRAARIEDGVEAIVAGDRILWRVRGAPLGSLEATAAGLHGATAAAPELVHLEHPHDVETFLDLLVREHLRLLEDDRPVEGGRIEIAKLARPSEPLLSPEELAAFRDA